MCYNIDIIKQTKLEVIKMKVYGMEMVLNDNGNVRLLYDEQDG